MTRLLINNDVLVTIITVTYNSQEYLESTIESILNQTYSNIEYIIIDGGSTDETLNIINKYKGYISNWISERDKGIYDAMNKGIKMANGEIIGIINSDDWLESDAIEKIVHKSNTIDHDEYIIHGKIAIYDSNNNQLTIRFPKNYPLYYLFSTPFKHPSMFISKKTYDKFGNFDTNCGLAADYDLMLRLMFNGVTDFYIEKVITNVRLVGISTGGLLKAKDSEIFNIIKKNSKSSAKAFIGVIVRYIHRKINIIF